MKERGTTAGEEHEGGNARPVALVTGGSRGLGREIVLALARKGYRVAINYRSSEKEAEEAAALAGAGCRSFRADVGNCGAVASMAAMIAKEFGRLDAVINNAGITTDKLLLKQTEEEWDAIIGTNLTGCFNVISAMTPLLKNSGGGHVINVSSYSGLRGKAGQAAYSASKAGLIGLSHTAAIELAADNIRVNVLLPGYMETSMGMNAARAAAMAKGQSILKTLSSPSEAARFVLYLLGTECVTGQIFSLDSRLR